MADLSFNSQYHQTADGVKTSWNFYFLGGYISREHVKAYHKSPLGVRVDLTIRPQDFIGPYQVRISPPVPAGHTLVIYRYTPRGLPLVDWQDGARVTETTLDTMAKQSVFVAAEQADVQAVLDSDPNIIQAVAGGGVFFENAQRVSSNYTISAAHNAFSAGPVTVDPGVTVAIPNGSRWVIV